MLEKFKIKQVCPYGLFKCNVQEKEDIILKFNDSELYDKRYHIGTKLNKIKLYFRKKEKLIGMETFFDNYLTGEKKQSGYHGGEKDNDEIETEYIEVGNADYIKNFEIELDDEHNYISYLKISSDKGKEIEFGEKKENHITILNFKGDNIIQYFYGEYDELGINNLGFYYMDKKYFYFNRIFPIIKLRYKINHDAEFKKKYEEKYKELLKDNKDMIYLYKSCVLPDNMFAKIIKYC